MEVLKQTPGGGKGDLSGQEHGAEKEGKKGAAPGETVMSKDVAGESGGEAGEESLQGNE